MPATLTAVPLPDSAAVRLHLSASVADYPTLISETLTGLPADAVTATAGRWSTYGQWTWSIASESGGSTLRFAPTSYNGSGAIAPRSYGIRRTLTGLTVGRRYLAYLGLRSDAGGGKAAEVSIGGTTILMRGGGFNPADGSWPVGESSAGFMPDTPFVIDFVATATSATLQITNQTADTYLGFGYSWMRVVPVLTSALIAQDNLAADDASITLTGAPPAGLQVARRFETVGNVAAIFSAPASALALPDDAVSLSKTLTGLTIGQRYRLTTAASSGYDSEFGAGGGPYRLTVVGSGQVVTSNGPVIWMGLEFVATATTHTFRVSTRAQTMTPDQTGALRLGYYRLDSVPSADDAYAVVSITRSDVNGVRPVRLYEGADLSNGELVAFDHEAALTGLVTYEAIVRNRLNAATERARASATLSAVTRSRLAPASLPQAGAWYDLAPDLSLGRESTTTLTQVINRNDPLVTLGSQTSRRGSLRVFADDYQMGAHLEQVFNRGEVVLLRQPDHPGLDMYLVGTRTSLAIQPQLTQPRRWILEVDYSEVAAPTTPLLGSAGWTIAASLTRNGTLAASRAEFPTILALLIGPDA